MALTGLQIFKLLPNTNCKDCGFQTCLAFAMKLAARQVELDLCPHASEEAKAALGAAAAPPVRRVTIGTGERQIVVGEETVLFRHEKTFVHATALAVAVGDGLSDGEIDERIARIRNVRFERAGETLTLDLVAVSSETGDAERFARVARKVAEETGLPLILRCEDPARMRRALEVCGPLHPLLHAATAENTPQMADLAREFSAPLVVRATDSLDRLHALAVDLRGRGLADLVLEPGASTLAGMLERQTLIRRAALERSDKDFGFPTIAVLDATGRSALGRSAAAALAICKYVSILLLEGDEPWMFLPLLTLRQNIYTDPQRPLQVDPGIYPIGDPGPDAPVAVTTNFSLTYFMVSSEIESSGVPAHLVVVDAEGMSVLTAWSAGKFGGERVGKQILESRIADRVSHRKVIIPGYVAVIQGDLEDALPGWEVLVGPEEAGDIPVYLKEVWE